jgi:DNA anti-recombination protein RmuC
MIMSFPMASMQKEEEEVLTVIDVFCNEKLLPKLNDSVTSEISDTLLSQAENIPAFAASLSKAHELFLVKLTEASTTLRDVSETLKTRLDTHQTSVEETFKTAVDKLTSSSIVSLSKPTEQLNEYFASLSKGVESLNDTLKALGGETITIQKRGWFAGK